jgi:hypothetical protein
VELSPPNAPSKLCLIILRHVEAEPASKILWFIAEGREKEKRTKGSVQEYV